MAQGEALRAFASYEAAALEDRCASRSVVEMPAVLRRSGARGASTVVLDLSLAGFSAHCPDHMLPGMVCWLTLPGLEPLQAEVIWWSESKVGCAFRKLLNPVVLESVLAKAARLADQGRRRNPVRPC